MEDLLQQIKLVRFSHLNLARSPLSVYQAHIFEQGQS